MKHLFFACVLMMSTSVFACGGSDKTSDTSESSSSESTVMTSSSSDSDTVASVDSSGE